MCVTSSGTLRSCQPMKTAPVPFPTLRQQKLLPEISEELPLLDFKLVLHIFFSVKNLDKQMKIRSINIKRFYCCDTGHTNPEISPQTTDHKSLFYFLENESKILINVAIHQSIKYKLKATIIAEWIVFSVSSHLSHSRSSWILKSSNLK